MADLRLDTTAMLAAVLDRSSDPRAWVRGIVQQLPEMLERERTYSALLGVCSARSWTRRLREAREAGLKFNEEVASHWLMQPAMDTQRAVQVLGLPAHTAAAVLERLPGPTCSREELRAAVQHPSVTQPLLQHLRQAAEDGSGTAVQHWTGRALVGALCEAARLADLPLLDYFVEAVPKVALRRARQKVQREQELRERRTAAQQQAQQKVGRQAEQQQQQAEEEEESWQRKRLDGHVRDYTCDAAAAALKAAATGGAVAVVRLAAAAGGGHAASAVGQLLHPAYIHCADEAARQGRGAALQLLLDEACQPLQPLASKLLRSALLSKQLAILSLVLDKCGPPGNCEPLLMQAVQTRQPTAFQLLADRCGLPAEPRQLLLTAIRSDQLPVVQLLLARSGLEPDATLICEAIRVPSPAAVQALLAAGSGPVAAPPPAGVAPFAQPIISLDGRIEEAPYTCPVLVALQQRARTDRASARQLLEIMEALQAAGYRPTVYRNVRVRFRHSQEAQLVQQFDAVAEDPRLDLQGANKFLWLALERPEWTPETHHRFHPRFRRAVRALLLAAHRGRQPDGAEQQHLAAVPNELLLRILGPMAYPLSAWAPQPLG